MKKLLLVCMLLLVFVSASFAEMTEAFGEAEVKAGDTATARLQAIARAKWAALEQAAGVQVKSEVLVHNAVLVDEAIKNEVKGVVKTFKVLDEGVDGTIFWVKINADIEKDKAEKAVGVFAKNTSVSVMLPVEFADGRVEETNALSERVISELTEQGFEVVDIAASGDAQTAMLMQKALKTKNYTVLRNIAARYLTNVMLIGKVKVVDKGNNIGYGNISFGIVNGELDFRAIGKKNGQDVILASGTLRGRGQGATVEDAGYRMLDNLAQQATNAVVNKMVEKVKGEGKRKIRVVLAGNTDLDKLMELKNDVQYMSWVLSVQEQGTDALMVEYPEKTLYLASFINSKGKYNVKKMTDHEILVEMF